MVISQSNCDYIFPYYPDWQLVSASRQTKLTKAKLTKTTLMKIPNPAAMTPKT